MSVRKLPSQYEQIKTINLRKDRKTSAIVNTISAALIVFMLILGAVLYGKNALENLLLLDERVELWHFIGRVIIVTVLCAVYIVLHELVHAVLMKLFCRNCSVKIGYRFFYAYAASDAYYDRRSYNIIAVAPLLFFGTLLSVLCAIVPMSWFWTIYLVQVFNFSAASGDIYIFLFLSRMQNDILVKDDGTQIIVFGK